METGFDSSRGTQWHDERSLPTNSVPYLETVIVYQAISYVITSAN